MNKKYTQSSREHNRTDPREYQQSEVKSSRNNSKQYPYHVQSGASGHLQYQNQSHLRTNSETNRTNNTRVTEDRSPQETLQEGQVQRSIYNRFAEAPVPEDEYNQDRTERSERAGGQESMFQSSRGLPQQTSNSYQNQQATTLQALEDQYQYVCQQNENLKKQMALLEVSLHNETLTNEEQRAYIEVLKQALEVKMSENGILSFIRSLNQRSNLTEADLFLELTNMKQVIDAGTREKSLNEERSRELYLQIEQLSRTNEKLKQEKNKVVNENDRVSREMAKLLEDFELLKNENDKLNQEKDSLLDYIEEIRAKYDQMDEEHSISKENVQTYESKIAKLQEKNQELVNMLEQVEERDYNNTQVYEELSRSNTNLQRKYEELNRKYEELKIQQNTDASNIEQLNEDLKNYKNEYEALAEEHENLRQMHEELNQNHSELTQVHEEHSAKLKSALETSGVLSSEKENLRNEIQRQRQVIQELQDNKKQLEENVDTLSKHISELEVEAQKVEELEQLNQDLEKDLTQLKDILEENRVKNEKDRQAKAEEIKTLYQQASDLRIELRSLKEEYQKLKIERDSLESTNNDLSLELEKKQKTLIGYLKDISDLRQEAEEKQEQLDLRMSQLDKFESQVNELNAFVEECDEKVRRAYEAEEKLTQDLEALARENKRLKDEGAIMNQRSEKLKKDLEQAKQLTTEVLRSVENVPLENTENIEISLRSICEKVKSFKYDEEVNKKKLSEAEYKINILQQEIERLEVNNQKVSQSEVETYNENKRLKMELETLRDDINAQQIKNEKIRIEFDKLRGEYERKVREDELSFKEKAKTLEDKVTNLISEKSSLEYVVSKYRDFILNSEINDLIEQARMVHTQISRLDKDKLDVQIKMDWLKNAEKFSERSTPSKGSDTAKKRNVEGLRETLSEIESNVQICETKKKSIENELDRILTIEREKYFTYYELEKQNHQLKAELDLSLKENHLIEQTKDTLEASYNDLLKTLRRSKIEDKLNSSITVPEGSQYARKDYYGKFSVERSNRGNNDELASQQSITKRDLEHTGRSSHASIGRYHYRDGSDSNFSKQKE